jgi:hypothetical protein
VSRKKKIPPMNRVPRGLTGVLRVKEFGVASWCPTPDGSGPAEAVAFHLTFAGPGLGEQEIGLLLKSPEAVDQLVEMLLRHKADVWPRR